MNEFELLKSLISKINTLTENGEYEDAETLSKVYQRIKSVHTTTNIPLLNKGE